MSQSPYYEAPECHPTEIDWTSNKNSSLVTEPQQVDFSSKGDGESQEQQQETQQPQQQHAPNNASGGLWITIGALTIFSMLGNAFRVFIENLLGLSCISQSPEWIYEASDKLHLCITSPQTALFMDLPVNMLGSFIMGLLQPCQDIGLQSSVPIAFLKAKHWFQTSQVVHIALRTGFCGSLTTFSSWNTSMLLLLSTDNILAALFGYVIGTKLSISSLKVGQQISIWMHRYMNPHLANAEDLQYSSQHSPINQRVLQDLYQKNRVLPDFERRYLDGLLSKQEIQWVKQRVNALDALDQWKQTTQDHRAQPYLLARGSYSSSASRRSINTSSTPTIHPSPSYLMENKLLTMQEIERKIIVERQDPSENVLRVAREHGWDVDALKTWADQVIAVSNEEAAVMELQKQKDPTPSRSAHKKTMIFLGVHALIATVLLLYFAYLSVSSATTTDATYYQTVLLSTVIAPFGTLLRWWLSKLNGGMKRWNWFPLGTFLANIGGSILSGSLAAILAVRYSYYTTPLSIILRAIAIGFTGCFTTVSTFVTEYDKLSKTFPQHGKAAYYVIASLLTACVLGLALYLPLMSQIF